MTRRIAKTKWFPSAIKPVRIGVYQTRDEYGCIWHNYWSGKFWCFGGCGEIHAYLRDKSRADFQDRRWRGLASDPND